MPRPRITPDFNWLRYEQAVLDVFTEALNRLANEPSLPQGEEPINFELYWKCRKVHHEQLQAERSIPFFILFDSTNQPQSDDTVRSRRLKKRPDSGCALTNSQAIDFKKSQIVYSLECKRLGVAAGKWVFTVNYSEHGMLRFQQANHSYAKGSSSAAMIGYAQSMPEDDLLHEVNVHATARTIPSLSKAATAWAAKAVTPLDQRPLTRDFDPALIKLRHLWLDLRHMMFTAPPPTPAAKPKKTAKKATKESAVKAMKKASSKCFQPGPYAASRRKRSN
jgi:hypothetical protein